MSTRQLTVNPFQRLKGVLPKGGRTYATVQSVNSGNDTSVVQLQSGDTLTVRGSSAAVAARVLILDGEIRQTVPTLPFTTINLF